MFASFHKYRQLMLLGIFLFSLVNPCERRNYLPQQKTPTVKESLGRLLHAATLDSLPVERRKAYLAKAFWQSIGLHDTLRQQILRDIAYKAYLIKDTVLFKESNEEGFLLAQKVKDSSGIADAYWNSAAFYLDREVYDKAYENYKKAYDIYSSLPEAYYAGKMLYNMAFIRGRLKDYTACEVLLFQAIKHFEKEGRNKQLFKCYTHLGVVYDELKEYDKAISYHQKAQEYLQELDLKDAVYLQELENNIGMIYQKTGNQREAIRYFNKALATANLKLKDPKLYARLIDNRALSRFNLDDTIGLLQGFREALNLRDSLNFLPGKVISHLHLATYYLSMRDSSKALRNGQRALALAKSKSLNRDILSALLLLAKIDKASAEDYLTEYIVLSQKIQDQERVTRNKFTRIEYETDRYVKENRLLSRQNFFLLVSGAALLFIAFLLYYINRQSSKNKLLQIENEKKEANEQIYRLSLKQYAQQEEGRLQERTRISEELHDGILSKLFGIRFNWEYLSLDGSSKDLKTHRGFLKSLRELEEEIRRISYDLRNNFFGTSNFSFEKTIEQLIKERSEMGGFNYDFYSDSSIEWQKIDDFVKANLYRIIEEALQNCSKHAEAERVKVHLMDKKGKLELEVSDNGKGFTKRAQKKSMGIKNMSSRAAKIGGIFSVTSDKAQGTAITVVVKM